MPTKHVTDDSFETDVLNAPEPVLVDFWAEWCGPCKMLAPLLDDLASEYEGKITIGKVDVDNNQKLAAQFGITNIPTLLLFKDGQVTEQIMGLNSKKVYKEKLDQALA